VQAGGISSGCISAYQARKAAPKAMTAAKAQMVAVSALCIVLLNIGISFL
jgi:hypothetical protein